MSPAGVGFVVASGVQGGDAPAPAYETLSIGLVAAAIVAVSVLIFIYLRRHRRPQPVADQWQALTVMGELCPHGWQAQITVIADTGDGRPSGHAPVALDWAELTDDDGRPAVTRRVWAPTIGEALDAMVADRRTDETLEQIEHRAVADGITWPDV